MLSQDLKDNIKRHYGDSDEDLQDLGAVMDALDGVDRLESLQTQLETMGIEYEKKLKDLDTTWRNRYRERFFDGDISTPVIDDLPDGEDEPAEISIEDYLEKISGGKK